MTMVPYVGFEIHVPVHNNPLYSRVLIFMVYHTHVDITTNDTVVISKYTNTSTTLTGETMIHSPMKHYRYMVGPVHSYSYLQTHSQIATPTYYVMMI